MTIISLIVRKIMLNSSSMELYWKNLESKKPPPKFVKKISIIEFDKLKNQ